MFVVIAVRKAWYVNKIFTFNIFEDKKIALIARLTGFISSLCDYVKSCYAKKQLDSFHLGMKLLKSMCSCGKLTLCVESKLFRKKFGNYLEKFA